MSKVVWKGGTLLGPLPPVMVSCGSMERGNIITVAWCGILASDPPKMYVSIRPSRHSYEIIKNSGELAVNLTTRKMAYQCDWCGIRSGRDVDKFERMKLGKQKSEKLDCPIIEQSPLSLECKVSQILPMGSHDVFVCDIVAVDVDESLIDKAGKLHLEKADLIGYCHGTYYSLGASLGSFGFSHAKKKKKGTPRRT